MGRGVIRYRPFLSVVPYFSENLPLYLINTPFPKNFQNTVPYRRPFSETLFLSISSKLSHYPPLFKSKLETYVVLHISDKLDDKKNKTHQMIVYFYNLLNPLTFYGHLTFSQFLRRRHILDYKLISSHFLTFWAS